MNIAGCVYEVIYVLLEALCDDDNDNDDGDDDDIFKIIQYVFTLIMFSLHPNRHIMIQLMNQQKSNSLFRWLERQESLR